MTLEVVWTTQFKKDYKRAKARKKNIEKLKFVVNQLAEEKELAPKYRDHSLVGKWISFRECHIEPDWLLVYRIENDTLVLTLARTGTHSDIFNS